MENKNFHVGTGLRVFMIFALAAGLAALPVGAAHADSLTVTSLTDDGAGSLRQTIAGAASGDTIIFASGLSGGTIHLASPLVISRNLTIDGSALAAQLTISGDTDGDGTGDVGVFHVNSGVTFTLENITVENGEGYNGGGIYNAGTLNVTGSTISGNHSDNAGGGIYTYYGTVNVTGSTFSNNSTDNRGGGFYNNLGTVNVTNSTFYNNHSPHNAGGIYNMTGALSVTDSTFSNNTAFEGGAIETEGSAPDLATTTVANSTFSGNGAQYLGGAFYAYTDSDSYVTNSTFYGNNADHGGGMYIEEGTLTIKNTLLANNSSGGNCAAGSVYDDGGNLEDGSSCRFSAATSISNTNPLLGGLGNYGGSTQTFPLLPGSPAINAGVSATCAAAVGSSDYGAGGQDQRGVTRPSACDIGAFESQGFTLTRTGGDHQSALTNAAFATPLGLTVTSAFGEPVDGGQVTFTPPGSGASAAITTSPAMISGGAASVTATANGIIGSYSVAASTAGATGVDFALTNYRISTTTTLASSSNPATVGDSVTFTATITPSGATGTVEFQDGSTDIPGCGNVIVSSDQATCTTSTLAAGTHTITAFYSGSTGYYSSSGTLAPDQRVFLITTTTSLDSSLNPSAVGDSVTFTATISPSGATGTVEFQDGSTDIPGCGNVSVNADQATCTTTTLTAGMHTITAIYSGDTSYDSSTGTLSPDQQVLNCAHTITVTSDSDTAAGSLRQAIADVCVGGTINFDADHTITLASTLSICESMTIDGSGHKVIISGANSVPVFTANAPIFIGSFTLNINKITVENGKNTAEGGGISSSNVTLNVTDSTFSGNHAYDGGGIYNNLGTLTVTGSSFIGNGAAADGGGIYK